MPMGELRLSGSAGECLLAALRAKRNVHAECSLEGERSVVRDVARLLVHRLPGFWDFVSNGDVDGLVEEAKRPRLLRRLKKPKAIYGAPLP